MEESERKLHGEIVLRTQEGIKSAQWEKVSLRGIFLSKTKERRRWLSTWKYLAVQSREDDATY